MSALRSIVGRRLGHAPHDNSNHGHALAVREDTSLLIHPELFEQASCVIHEQWCALEPGADLTGNGDHDPFGAGLVIDHPPPLIGLRHRRWRVVGWLGI